MMARTQSTRLTASSIFGPSRKKEIALCDSRSAIGLKFLLKFKTSLPAFCRTVPFFSTPATASLCRPEIQVVLIDKAFVFIVDLLHIEHRRGFVD
jgi:hypothetical protein